MIGNTRLVLLSLLLGGILHASVAEDAGKSPPRPARGTLRFGTGERLSENGTSARELSNAFVRVVQHVTPSVVSVYTTKVVDVAPAMNPLFPFFGPDAEGGPDGSPEHRKQEGGGSGFVISDRGYIMTNAHVIMGMDEVIVELHDRTRFSAEIVGIDEKSDVAVIKIAPKDVKLQVASFGNSDDVRIGEWVLAIGQPFLFRNTVTAGIVSALDRTEAPDREAYADYIQTDAAVNPGNSGGPLVNLNGEVIGINSSIWTRSGGYQGISFAIPINQAIRTAEDLIFEGSVSRGWLGIGIDDIDPELAEAMGIQGRNGAKVVQVMPNSPAAKQNLKAGDIILRVNDKTVPSSSYLRNLIAGFRPGESVDLAILRDGKEQRVKITLGKREDEAKVAEQGKPAEEDKDSAEAVKGTFLSERTGLRLSNLDARNRQNWKIAEGATGVLVEGVANGSPAADKSIPPGALVTMFKRAADPAPLPAKNAKELAKALDETPEGSTVALLLSFQERTFWIGVKSAKSTPKNGAKNAPKAAPRRR